MEYRPLGRTGLDVSVLSFGAASLGSVYREIDEAEGIRAVHTALDLGINLIDCSPYYGLTRAEIVLGRALREIDRDRYYLATKTGRFGLEEFDFSAARIRKSLEESLSRLGVETIDLFQLHDIEFGSIPSILDESVPELQALKQAGKIRSWGVTGFPLKAFRTFIAVARPDTILSYCHHALNDDTLVDVLAEMNDRGIGVISASPTSMGLLTDRGPPDWHPADVDIRDACRAAAAWCRERGVPITKLALQFATQNEGIATTLVGTASPTNIADNVAWIEEPYDEQLVATVRGMLHSVQGKTWSQGRPENN